jgi:hypothetical protein
VHVDHPTGLEPQCLGQEDRGQDNSSRKASSALMPLARSASTIGRCQLDIPFAAVVMASARSSRLVVPER